MDSLACVKSGRFVKKKKMRFQKYLDSCGHECEYSRISSLVATRDVSQERVSLPHLPQNVPGGEGGGKRRLYSQASVNRALVR